VVARHTIHERMISVLQRDYPESQTRGFRKAMQKLKWDWENWDAPDPGEAEKTKPTWTDFLDWGEAWNDRIIPDLWFIDEEFMSVVCIEVEDTSRINTRKLDTYVRLWWYLDEMDWETHLLCSDRWGVLSAVPLTSFTSMGLVETKDHHLANVIEAEREAKKITFELTKVYCIRDARQRNAARREWLERNPGFGLKTNPDFNSMAFLVRRGL
jgi:hypothetical protein